MQGSGQRREGMTALLRNAHPQIAVILTRDLNCRRFLRNTHYQPGQLDDLSSGDYGVQLRSGQEQLARRRVGQAGSRSLGRTGLDLLADAEDGIINSLRVEQDQRSAGGVVKNGFETGVQERLQKVDTLEIDRILQIFQYRAAAVGGDVEIVAELFQARRDIRQQFVRQQQFPRGEQHQLFNRLQGSLRQWIKGAHGFGRVAEKL